jgi:uncharacterized protein YxeA
MLNQNKIVILILILSILLILYIIISIYGKIKINSNKIDILGRYVNTYMNTSKITNTTASVKKNISNNSKKSDNQEKGIKKFVIYHMKGCGHCHNFMDKKQENGMSKCEELRQVFKNDTSIQILDFQYGIDNEAKKFKAFPMFRIITENGITDYTDKREVSSIQEAINNAI